MKQQLELEISAIVKRLFDLDIAIELTRPDEKFGDFATNIALQLATATTKNPRAIAEQLLSEIEKVQSVAHIRVAGPGFINITLKNTALISMIQANVSTYNEGKRVLLEYSCPNAFKELHTGHLYQTIVGDAIGRILEATGVTVFRANFGGDVGLHVAKCLYGIIEAIGGEGQYSKIQDVDHARRSEWLSAQYVRGAAAYEQDELAKSKIATLNTRVYHIQAEQDHQSDLSQIYWECRTWSYDYFKAFYNSVAVEPFDAYYPESATSDAGLAIVRANTPQTFQESDGAIVFKGEAVGLHTSVFITSKGLPTYQAKDLGVILNEIEDFTYDQRIIITGNDQTEYMRIIFAALASFNPDLAARQLHRPNGTVKFSSGQKMSSRLGNVTRAVDVLNVVHEAVAAENPQAKNDISLGAIKYSFLKHRIGGDIAFDVNESIRLEGNSGPYLQYAHTRAVSILQKSNSDTAAPLEAVESDERSLLRKLAEYNEVVTKATHELMPHLICTYLYDLAQSFNRFYENNRVIGDDRESIRIALVACYAHTLKSGLVMLGIPIPDKM
jgi:arginyl-tRNA synthetase